MHFDKDNEMRLCNSVDGLNCSKFDIKKKRRAYLLISNIADAYLFFSEVSLSIDQSD